LIQFRFVVRTVFSSKAVRLTFWTNYAQLASSNSGHEQWIKVSIMCTAL